MNKQKKRHINQYKFDRVMINGSTPSNFVFHANAIGCVFNGFMYWHDINSNNYFRIKWK